MCRLCVGFGFSLQLQQLCICMFLRLLRADAPLGLVVQRLLCVTPGLTFSLPPVALFGNAFLCQLELLPRLQQLLAQVLHSFRDVALGHRLGVSRRRL